MFFLKKLLSLGGNAAANKFRDKEKPFLDHLEDLRGTMIKVFGTLIVSTIIAFIFYKGLIEVIKYPIIKANEAGANLDTELRVFSPVEGFMSVIKICLYAALIGSFPILLYFIGEFIIPGLNKKEKKLILPVVFASFILFSIGVVFAYFVVIPRALEFFDSFNAGVDISTDLRFKYTVSFITMLCLVFGLCFELPVVVLTLVKLDLLNSKMMRATRSYAIVAMFVLAAVITPTPDIFTMSLLAGPMVLLYEFCIWMAWYMERKEAKKEARRQERDRQTLIDRQQDSPEKDDGNGPANLKSKDTGTLEYNSDNEVIYEDQNSDVIEEGGEGAAFDEYHTGLNDEVEPVDPASDSVWGYSDQAKGGSVPEESDTNTDDHHYDHDYHDHGHYDDGYYSGPTEELKKILQTELREDIKHDIMHDIKQELKDELKAELLEELKKDLKDEGSEEE